MWPFRKREAPVQVNVNIDYDKLAEAIVRAQEKVAKENTRKSIFRSSFMGGVNACLYFAISLFGAAMVLGSFIAPAVSTQSRIVYAVLFGILAMYSFACFIESMKDHGENIQQHFNTNVALAALIVAIINLFREVL